MRQSFTLKHDKRAKRIILRIVDGKLIVTAPKRYRVKDIQSALTENHDWIERHLKKYQQTEKHKEKQRFQPGGQFRYLGNWLTLKLGNVASPQLRESSLILPQNQDLQTSLYQWYQEKALALLTDKTHFYADKLGVSVNGIRLGKFKSKWGSCHANKTISYSWPIIQAPEPIIDYLVIHEVAHLLEMNHSHRFWGIVESLCPTYKERKKWLKEQSSKLSLL